MYISIHKNIFFCIFKLFMCSWYISKKKKVLFYAGMYICTYIYMNFYKFTHSYKD